MVKRIAKLERKTLETDISIEIDLDGSGEADLSSGIPFFDHMLDQICRHGLIDIKLQAKGDLEIDAHHTMEDIGITLGQALAQAIGDKKGITRYGHSYVPLDESLSRVVIDFSGRPALEYFVDFPREEVGGIDVDLIREFFQALVNNAAINLHIDTIRGTNGHHIAETIFKAFGRAVRMAITHDSRIEGITPSTKGSL